MSDQIPLARGPRFLYIYAEPRPGDGDVPEGETYFVGKLLTEHREVVDLVVQLLGARTATGRTVCMVEVGKANEGAAIDSVHTLTITRPNDEKDPQ